MDFRNLTIADAREQLQGGLSAVDLTEAAIAEVEAAAPLNAYVHTTFDKAREQAKAADANKTGALSGIPLGIKDLFCVENVPTQAASKILDGFKPQYESTVTRKLWESGAVMLGKLNMDEFAMGSSNEHSVYGPAVSPWRRKGDDAQITAGGSSGGSAAAVAAGICLGATGTDTGGSIRQPAAFTGTVGLKPTYGRVSRWGIVAYASSLDQAGPMTKTVRDAAIMLGAMAGHDKMDSTSANVPVPDYEAALTGDLKGKRIGIPKEYRLEGLSDEIDAAWKKGADLLRDQGAEIVDISLPHTKYALPAYYIIAPAEASSNLSRYDGVRYGYRAKLDAGDGVQDMYEKTRAEGFGSEVRRRVMVGAYVLSAGFYDAYYRKAQRVRRLVRRDFTDAFGQVDAILAPATPTPAFGLGEVADSDPIAMYLNDVFTITVNLSGLPAVSVPTSLTNSGLPLGLQLIGRPFEEDALLNLAYGLESAAEFSAKPEVWWR
ncbi:Asp-tRNA(Asn)/Glu-tRNA(Gln) amidotransferase subunit GatA [Paracoccaceae bacterium GXU_MW_L88]